MTDIETPDPEGATYKMIDATLDFIARMVKSTDDEVVFWHGPDEGLPLRLRTAFKAAYLVLNIHNNPDISDKFVQRLEGVLDMVGGAYITEING